MTTLLNDTIAAIATPPGEGGIAIIRISGPDAIPIGDRLFSMHSGDSLNNNQGYTVHFGRFTDATGGAVDTGLATLFRAPRSYTGENTVELSCHGGRATTAQLLSLALQAGARLAQPGEFTQRAFLNGRMDLTQAEAVADVIRARTEMARRIAYRQLEGALSDVIGLLRDELVGIIAAIEVTIDFSDEVGELDYELLAARIKTCETKIETLLASAKTGRMLREGLRVVILGRPNVGKSSLLNALLKTERAIVTPIAGTTRDLLEETITLGGIPINLVDTAGIRDTDDVVERIGVARALSAGKNADIRLVVLDAVAGYENDPYSLLPELDETPTVFVVNKCDLVDQNTVNTFRTDLAARLPGTTAIVAVSAFTGAGITELEALLIDVLGAKQMDAPETIIVTNIRHQTALETAQLALSEAQNSVAQHLPGDFIGIDIRGALNALGEITGETVTDEIVHRIFSDFCVGK